MKLVQCKIENFGKLSDFSFDFSEGIHIICQKNGWGKSTLAAFIRVMFFGFENSGKKDKLINERKRFTPWQGGVYGGSITFEVKGKQYIMRRVFDKREKDDEFELREADTNLPSEDFSSNIGEELFGIDAASFRRTVFLSQQDCEAEATDRVHAKLGNLVENTDDINSFQTVYNKLKDQTTKMSPNRKTGSLNKEKVVISDMENSLREEDSVVKSIREVEELRKVQADRRDDLDREIQKAQKNQAKISETLDFGVKKKEYATLLASCQEAQEALAVMQNRFPDKEHIPSQEQVEKWQDQERQCEEYRDILLENQLTPEEMTSFRQVKHLLGNQIPSEEDMEELEEALKEYDGLKLTILSERLAPEEEREWEELSAKYPQGVPTEAELQQIRDVWEEAQRKRETLTSKQAMIDTLSQVKEHRKNPHFLPSLLLAVLALVAGFCISYFVQAASGVIVAVILLVVAVVILFISKKEETPEENSSLLQLQEELAADQESVQQGMEQMQSFCRKFSLSGEVGEIRTQLSTLQIDAAKYRSLAVRKQAVDEDKERRFETLQTSLANFMKLYYPEGVPEEQWAFRLSSLKEKVHNFGRWTPKVNVYRDTDSKFRECHQQLAESLQKYGFEIQNPVSRQLQDIRDMVNHYSQAQEACRIAGQRKAEFEQTNDSKKLMEMPEPENEDSLSEIHEKLEQYLEEKELARKTIADYDNQLQELQERADELAALRVELEERKEMYSEGKRKHDLILKTMELLQRARDTLTARYMGPVQKGFEKYYRILSGEEASGYQFDAGANLTVQELGMSREIRFLSEGRKDLVGICTRMALVDAMYEVEKPFLVLDDPFVNLDDTKLEKATDFLQEIGKEYQVIYFTCHEKAE